MPARSKVGVPNNKAKISKAAVVRPVWLRRPRLLFGLALGLLTYAILRYAVGFDARLGFISAFDLGASATLIALYVAFRHSTVDAMRQNAVGQDVGAYLVLALAFVAATAGLVVIASEMPLVKQAADLEKYLRAVLVVFTIVLSWAFIQTIFAFHYAHDFYLDRDSTGSKRVAGHERLHFPGGALPTYGDFLYFSFTIGMTFQTSDVQIADPAIRRVVMAHGIVAFFFTTGIVALAINLVAGLL